MRHQSLCLSLCISVALVFLFMCTFGAFFLRFDHHHHRSTCSDDKDGANRDGYHFNVEQEGHKRVRRHFQGDMHQKEKRRKRKEKKKVVKWHNFSSLPFILLIFLLVGCCAAAEHPGKGQKARNKQTNLCPAAHPSENEFSFDCFLPCPFFLFQKKKKKNILLVVY